MQNHILTPNQKELFPLLKKFKKYYYLAGGTAIALHIGHRRSIDFDLFTNSPIIEKDPHLLFIFDFNFQLKMNDDFRN